MTLNQDKTHLFNALICDEMALYGFPGISDVNYNNLCDEVATWVSEYNADNLYGTNSNGTFKYAGIGQTPVPPKRS